MRVPPRRRCPRARSTLWWRHQYRRLPPRALCVRLCDARGDHAAAAPGRERDDRPPETTAPPARAEHGGVCLSNLDQGIHVGHRDLEIVTHRGVRFAEELAEALQVA